MWVKAKEKTQLTVTDGHTLLISQSVQAGSKWLAFHEPEVIPSLPWRLNHKHLNIRMPEEKFRELFEEIRDRD